MEDGQKMALFVENSRKSHGYENIESFMQNPF